MKYTWLKSNVVYTYAQAALLCRNKCNFHNFSSLSMFYYIFHCKKNSVFTSTLWKFHNPLIRFFGQKWLIKCQLVRPILIDWLPKVMQEKVTFFHNNIRWFAVTFQVNSPREIGKNQSRLRLIERKISWIWSPECVTWFEWRISKTIEKNLRYLNKLKSINLRHESDFQTKSHFFTRAITQSFYGCMRAFSHFILK